MFAGPLHIKVMGGSLSSSRRPPAYRPTVFVIPHQVTIRPTFVTSQVPQSGRQDGPSPPTIFRSFHSPVSGNNERVPGADTAARNLLQCVRGYICYCLLVVLLAGALLFRFFLKQLFWISRAELLRVGSTAFKKSNFCSDGCLSAHPLLCP